jgi:hypothetical protein
MTLARLSERHGLRVTRWHVMDKVRVPLDQEDGPGRKVGKLVFMGADALLRRLLLRGNAWLADAIVAVTRPCQREIPGRGEPVGRDRGAPDDLHTHSVAIEERDDRSGSRAVANQRHRCDRFASHAGSGGSRRIRCLASPVKRV